MWRARASLVGIAGTAAGSAAYLSHRRWACAEQTGHRAAISSQSALHHEQQVVVITGCTSGLGRALAGEFRRLGHTVIGCGRRMERLSEMQRQFGPPHQFHFCDVKEEQSVCAFASHVGACDIVIANAGTVSEANVPPWEADADEFRDIVQTNLLGVYHVTRHFGPKLKQQAETSGHHGEPPKRLVNISSGAGHTSNPWQSACEHAQERLKLRINGNPSYHICAHPTLQTHSSPSVRALRFGLQMGSRVAEHVDEPGDTGMRARVAPRIALAPGSVESEMNRDPGAHALERWAPVAAQRILSLRPEDSGSAIALAEFYDEAYVGSWVIPSGARAPPFDGWG